MRSKRIPDRDDQAAEFKGIELLVISPSQDTAEVVQTQLRDAGHNVHATWLDKPENVADALQSKLPRLICYHEQSGEQDIHRLIGLCLNIAPGIPVIAVVSTLDPARSADLLKAGAAQVVSPEHKVLMTRALERELESVNLQDKLKYSRRQVSGLRRQLGAIVAESPEALAYVHDGIHTHLNQSYVKLFGFDDPAEFEGVPLMDLVAPESRDSIKALLNRAAKPDEKPDPERFVAQRADDSNITLNMRCRPVSMEGEKQTEVMVFQEASSTIAPPPTNPFEARIALYETLEEVKALRLKERALGIVFICIDDLENLQDRMGLYAADQIMSEVSLFLLANLSDADQSFRFDVGEYVVLVSGQSSADIKASAEQIRAAIDAEVFGDEHASSPLTASIAVAFASEDSGNIPRLLKAQRLARKTSVRDGNTVVMATADEDQPSNSQDSDHAWLTRIKAGLEGDSFALAFQSINSLEGESRQLSEVQLRLVGEKGEGIHAGEFLPTAQRHGLMPMIDQWVVGQVLELAHRQRGRKEHSLMFIKLSRAAIDNSDAFIPWLQKQIAEYEIDTADIAVAFDEETLQFNVKKATSVVQTLKSMGLKLAVHGFGNSANSLQLLELVNADYVRLDPLFTESLIAPEDNQRFADMVQSVKDGDTKIIASQVEDANSMARLWQSGVHYVQGHFVQESDSSHKSDLNVA